MPKPPVYQLLDSFGNRYVVMLTSDEETVLAITFFPADSNVGSLVRYVDLQPEAQYMIDELTS